MSHQEVGRIEYTNACRVMLDQATERIDATIDTMSALLKNSSSIVDAEIRNMMKSLVESAEDVKKQIAEKKSGFGTGYAAYAEEVGSTRQFLSVVNTVVLKANALNSAVSDAYNNAISSGKNHDLESRISEIPDGNLRRMMTLLSRNPAHSDMEFEELRTLAECKLDPSKKVKRHLVSDTVSDVRRAMSEEKVAKEAIDTVIGTSPEVSPLELMDAATSEIIDEKLRRSAVKAIVGCITSKGFVVRREDIRHIRENDIVKITA